MASNDNSTAIVVLNGSVTTEKDYYAIFMDYRERITEFVYPTLGVLLTVICVIGMIANAINVAALAMIIKKSKLPVYRCFFGLAIADFMVLLFFCIRNGTRFLTEPDVMMIDDTDIENALRDQTTNHIYHLTTHLVNIFMGASNWCIVVMSSLRCIAVFTPLWYQRRCGVVVVNVALVAAYIIGVLINIPDMLTTRYNSKERLFHKETPKSQFDSRVVTVLLMHVVPILITLILLIFLIKKLCSRPAIERAASNAEYRNKDKLQTSVTLVCISAFFVVCVTPSVGYFIYENFIKEREPDYELSAIRMHRLYKVHVVVELALVVNHTANFCFYVLLNARLRRKLRVIFRCSKENAKDRSQSLGCITHQSSLTERRTSGEFGDRNLSTGRSPSGMYGRNRHRRSCDMKQQTGRRGTSSSITTNKSLLSAGSNESHVKVGQRARKESGVAQPCLFNIDESSEGEKLLPRKERLNSTPETNADVTDSLNEMEESQFTHDDSRSRLLSRDSSQSDSAVSAPIATVDTMHDLYQQAK